MENGKILAIAVISMLFIPGLLGINEEDIQQNKAFPQSLDDTEPPEIENVVATPCSQWEGGKVKISCKVTDNVSVAKVKVIIEYPDSSTCNMTMKKDYTNEYYYSTFYYMVGTYHYYIWANDTSGNSNNSAIYTFEIKKDTYPPDTDCQLSGTISNNSWYVSDVTITLTVSDIGTGVKYTMYMLDDCCWKTYSAPFKVTDDGHHVVYYYSVDNVGNHESLECSHFKIDKKPPTTSSNLSGILGGKDWYITNVTVILTSVDETSGINQTMYRVDCCEWKTYSEPFKVTENGDHTVCYYSIDEAGNKEQEKSVEFKIDKKSPIVSIIRPKIGYLYRWDKEIRPTFTGNTVIIGGITVEATGTNHESGMSKVEFYIDNIFQYEDKEWPYSWLWDYLSFGTHVIKVVAYDNAGNTAMDEMTVKIFNI